MSIGVLQKDPGAVLDYTLDWTRWLPSGDRLVDSTWTVPSPLVLVQSTTSNQRSTVWISGGVAGTTYDVGCRVTTAAGRVDERTIAIQVVQR